MRPENFERVYHFIDTIDFDLSDLNVHTSNIYNRIITNNYTTNSEIKLAANFINFCQDSRKTLNDYWNVHVIPDNLKVMFTDREDHTLVDFEFNKLVNIKKLDKDLRRMLRMDLDNNGYYSQLVKKYANEHLHSIKSGIQD